MATARDLCERSLERARAARSVFITVTADRARREANQSDDRRRHGAIRSELDGVPVAFKDVFHVEDTTTTAGSASLSTASPATTDSALVRRARKLGLVLVGKTNLSEFAFSGLGVNRRFGTPANPYDAAVVPGGSSSGAAVSVAMGVVPLAIGTDTSGSVRVPAAFCGCVGYRASKNRYGPDDFITLSPTLDSVGIVGNTVDDVIALDRLLAGVKPSAETVNRAVIPAGEWVDDCTPVVRRLFDAAIDELRNRGITVDIVTLSSMDEAQRLMEAHGTIVGAEAFGAYGHLISSTQIEPATRRRLEQNADKTVGAVRARMNSLRRQLDNELAGAVLVCPTVRHKPPILRDLLASERLYDAANASTLRTTMVLSYLGTCGVSLPLRETDGRSSVGLLLSMPEGDDGRLLAVARQFSGYLA